MEGTVNSLSEAIVFLSREGAVAKLLSSDGNDSAMVLFGDVIPGTVQGYPKALFIEADEKGWKIAPPNEGQHDFEASRHSTLQEACQKVLAIIGEHSA
jgi:hypothetical protein